MGFVTLFDIARADMGEDPMEDAVFMGGRKGAPLPPPPPPPDPNAPLMLVPGAPGAPGAPMPAPGADPMAPFGAPAAPGALPPSSPGGFDSPAPSTPSQFPAADDEDDLAARPGKSREPMLFGMPRKQVLLVGGGIAILLVAVVAKKLKRASQPQQAWGPPPGWGQPTWGPPPGWGPPPHQAAPQPAPTPAPQPAPAAAPTQPQVTRNSRNSVLYEVNLGGPAHIEQVVPVAGGLAEFYRYGRLVRRFRPTDSQRKKILAGKGTIRIASKQVR